MSRRDNHSSNRELRDLGSRDGRDGRDGRESGRDRGQRDQREVDTRGRFQQDQISPRNSPYGQGDNSFSAYSTSTSPGSGLAQSGPPRVVRDANGYFVPPPSRPPAQPYPLSASASASHSMPDISMRSRSASASGTSNQSYARHEYSDRDAGRERDRENSKRGFNVPPRSISNNIITAASSSPPDNTSPIPNSPQMSRRFKSADTRLTASSSSSSSSSLSSSAAQSPLIGTSPQSARLKRRENTNSGFDFDNLLNDLDEATLSARDSNSSPRNHSNRPDVRSREKSENQSDDKGRVRRNVLEKNLENEEADRPVRSASKSAGIAYKGEINERPQRNKSRLRNEDRVKERKGSFDDLLNDLDGSISNKNLSAPVSAKESVANERSQWKRRDMQDRSGKADKTELEHSGFAEKGSIPIQDAADIEDREEERREREKMNEILKKAEAEEAAKMAIEKREEDRVKLERRDIEMRVQEMERRLKHGRPPTGVNESIIVPDYVQALERILDADTTASPSPDDFAFPEGYSIYQKKISCPLQILLREFVHDRFIASPHRRALKASSPIPQPKLFLKIIQARGLIYKDGRPRDAYSKIEYGDKPDDGAGPYKNSDVETFMTETVNQSLSPVWKQHLNVTVKRPNDSLIVSVWDRSKDHFLGQVKLIFRDMIGLAKRDGYVNRWYNLAPRDGRHKDKYVSGEIYIEYRLDESKDTNNGESDRIPFLESQLINCQINYKALYKTLLRSCLLLDINMIQRMTENTTELLSNESSACLKVWASHWAIGEASQLISYVELLFEKYKSYEIPVAALRMAYESIYERIKSNPKWLTQYDKPALVNLLENMYSYYEKQVTNYKEFYAKNKPDGALENTVFMWRIVFKSHIYREYHPELPISFGAHIKETMTNACKLRYEKLLALTSAFDESDIEGVIDGLTKLSELLTDEIEADVKYFKRPLRKDVDIVSVTSETYLDNFVAELEGHMEILSSDDAIEHASKGVFLFYNKIRAMDEKYVKLVPSLKKLPTYAKFNVERWFSPFILKWLDNLSLRTLEWVQNACKADTFEPNDAGNDGLQYSSSVTDVFTAIYQELDFITQLGWSNDVQRAAFLQKFAKTVSKAMENYCEAIGTGELKTEEKQSSKWIPMIGSRSAQGPKDINRETCVKLCNIEYAIRKIDEMYSMMNADALTRVTNDFRRRKTLKKKPIKRSSDTINVDDDEEEEVRGAFTIEILYAENIKPVTGLSPNPYVTIRVPEGTMTAPTTVHEITADLNENDQSSEPVPQPPPEKPVALHGSACEMLRTRHIKDTLNPSWDETFTILLPPVTQLDLCVYSKNLINADELCGKATIELHKGTRLRKKLKDHHTHDVYVETDPQGRILMRIMMEGDEENVDFWFRRSRERLGRTRGDFVRAICSKISPFIKEELVKAIKENQATTINQGYFSSLTGNVQYSKQTASGASTEKKMTSAEADNHLASISDYLNSNLETLCNYMPARVAKEVIKRIWEETLVTLELIMVPHLYGPIERDRRLLNRRQVSLIDWTVSILRDFFHADGAEMGLPIKVLESRKYGEITGLIDYYYDGTDVLMREYEESLNKGREKVLLLRLLRLRSEREELSAAEKDTSKNWLEKQLVSRKEKR